MRVLFIGNSYTFVNDVPGLTARIAASMGDTLAWDMSAPGGYAFALHLRLQATLAKINAGGWDAVVLQEQSQTPAFPQSQLRYAFFEPGAKLDSLVRVANPQARTYLYMTWGRRDGDAQNCASGITHMCTYRGMDSAIRKNYEYLADQIGAAISPVGPVWRRLRRQNPGITLYDTDGSHPSLAGAYAAACTFYATLFKRDPSLSTYTGGVPAANAAIIRQAARTAAYDSLAYWRINSLTSTRPQSGQALLAYPNPATSVLYIPGVEQAELITLYGIRHTLILRDGRADVTHLAPGVYTLVAAGRKRRVTLLH